MEYVLSIRQHYLLRKPIQIKKAVSKEQSRKKVVNEKHRKVFITGLPPTLQKSKFFRSFRAYNLILHIIWEH